MSMARIRQAYGVPAKRGTRIAFRGDPCTITGTSRNALHLRVRFNDEPKRTYAIHPTWEVTYPETKETQ